MHKLPTLNSLETTGKRVLLRMDLDVDNDFTRIELSAGTLKFLKEKNSKIIILGHKGRPEGKVVPELSLGYLASVISRISGMDVEFSSDITGDNVRQKTQELAEGKILLLENLRFHPGEETNDPEFVQSLSLLGEFYVIEAFAVSHREHASITGLPKVLPHAAGLRLEREVLTLSSIWEEPKRPVTAVISGVKKDKIERIASILDITDKVLVGGKLPIYLDQEMPQNKEEEFLQSVKDAIPVVAASEKVVIGKLIPDTQDITLHTIEIFKEEISKAGTIILAGVPGKYEDEGHRQGTKEVFEAIANSSAFKVAGGGDAEAAITLFGLNDKFDWISVGGGAMLEFIAKRTLPGIDALL